MLAEPSGEGPAAAGDRAHGRIARAVRGRDASPGAEEEHRRESAMGHGSTAGQAGIRGHGFAPGAGAEAKQQKARERLAARNAHLQQSLADHVERVANKMKTHGGQEARSGPTAAERLQALKRRVAMKSSVASGAHGVDAAAQAAAACAWHGRARGGAAGGEHQLSAI